MPTPPVAGTPLRNYHDEAVLALKDNQMLRAAQLLRADVLVDDDTTLSREVRWSPALKRPVAVVEWGFGAEVRVPGAGQLGRAHCR